MEPGVSDHALLCIKGGEGEKLERKPTCFKFINIVTDVKGYDEEVRNNLQR